ncbi:MAG: hypothetical protein KF906_08265 [Actinobacteria bacterium]|nr:hypothetical protein [Actinomycetota bacterium]
MTELATTGAMSLRRWVDDAPAAGVDPRSGYVDHFWIPSLGPTAVCLARTLMRMIAREDRTVVVRSEDLRAILGLHGADAPTALARAMDLLVEHGIVARGGIGDEVELLVRSRFPHLDDALVAALPGDLGVAHGAPHSLQAAATLDAPLGRRRAQGPHLRALSLAAGVDEILVDPSLDPGQLAFRWQHVIRLAEEARDDAVLDWAPADVESSLAECHLACQAMSEAIWAAQRAVATRGAIGEDQRSDLAGAAAGIIDWLVSEYPSASTSGFEI